MNTVQQLIGRQPLTVTKVKRAVEGKTSNDTLVVGVELEIEVLPNGQTWYQRQADALTPGFWMVAADGSLRPRNEAWEFISAPATIAAMIGELEAFFGHFKFNEKNYSDRCSIHVHTNVLDWTPENLSNFAMVYPVFEEVLFRFVNHYKAPTAEGYCRDTNLYCIPWNQCRMNRKMVEELIGSPLVKANNWQKYTAVNILPVLDKGTMEWRHMHGTADMEKITKWLSIIAAIMKFCRETDLQDTVKTIRTLNDSSAYAEFFTAVLRGSLEYTEEYSRSMAEGVLNAKFSLMGYGKPKKESSEPVVDTAQDRLIANLQAAAVRVEAARRAGVVGRAEAPPVAARRWDVTPGIMDDITPEVFNTVNQQEDTL
jgi:hypothetical protein